MTTSAKIEPANWKANLEELVSINSPEAVVICMPSRMGKTQQDMIANTLQKQKK